MSNVENNETFYQRIRAGDKSAIDEAIVGNLPLVKSRVGEFLKEYRRFRHLFDDLYSEGMLALTQAVNSFAETDVEKPTGYIVSAIDYAIKNSIDSEVGAGMMPRRTVQRRRTRGESLPNQLPFDVANPPARMWQNATGRVVRKNTEHELPSGEIQDTEIPPSEFGVKTKGTSHTDAEQFIANFEQNESTDLLDSILSCCESEQETAIVHFRIEGLNDAEIGERLGLSRQTVNRRRKEIETRFERTKKPGQ